jgi:hypothetical protein
VARPFEWKWYYAFQEVGDLRAAPLSDARRRGIAERDRLAGAWAWASPSALVERALQRVAGTDVDASQRYLDRVRAFHAALREFHYPKLFRDEPLDAARSADLPMWSPGLPARQTARGRERPQHRVEGALAEERGAVADTLQALGDVVAVEILVAGLEDGQQHEPHESGVQVFLELTVGSRHRTVP